MRVLALLLLLGTALGAEPLPPVGGLTRLMDFQRLGDPGCFVSSGFHDWRGVSRYRSRPGLHLGYDLAMPAGTGVRAAWDGTVVAVTPWYGEEFGVTVRSRNQVETTYGHLRPMVSVGEWVEAGELVGTVVVDHVDVKMRDSRGDPLDFALWRSNPVLPVQVRPPARDDKRRREAAEALAKARLYYDNGLITARELEAARQRLEQGP